jgi:NAD(P)-dependent dehydrogenase (short-subunit alcohol dehydrogenase family)
MKSSNKLRGKVALITGGTSGLGLATARRFVAEGAQVFVTGRRQDAVDAAVKDIGGTITGVQGDVAKLADLDRLYDIIREKANRLDILFANAGGGALVPLAQVTEEHFDKYFGINVKGTLFTVQKALPLMTAGGAIVINGSMVSIKGFPAFGVYAATKAALRSFVRTWTMDLKGTHIRVNMVSSGTVVTPGYKSELPNSGRLSIRKFSISGRSGSSLLFPGPVGLPSFIPCAFLKGKASLVRCEIRSSSISAAIEKAIAMILLWMLWSKRQFPLTE